MKLNEKIEDKKFKVMQTLSTNSTTRARGGLTLRDDAMKHQYPFLQDHKSTSLESLKQLRSNITSCRKVLSCYGLMN